MGNKQNLTHLNHKEAEESFSWLDKAEFSENLPAFEAISAVDAGFSQNATQPYYS